MHWVKHCECSFLWEYYAYTAKHICVCVHACQRMTMDELWAYHRFTNGFFNDSFSPFHLGRLMFGCLALSGELWASRCASAERSVTMAVARQDESLRAQPNVPYLSCCFWLWGNATHNRSQIRFVRSFFLFLIIFLIARLFDILNAHHFFFWVYSSKCMKAIYQKK